MSATINRRGLLRELATMPQTSLRVNSLHLLSICLTASLSRCCSTLRHTSVLNNSYMCSHYRDSVVGITEIRVQWRSLARQCFSGYVYLGIYTVYIYQRLHVIQLRCSPSIYFQFLLKKLSKPFHYSVSALKNSLPSDLSKVQTIGDLYAECIVILPVKCIRQPQEIIVGASFFFVLFICCIITVTGKEHTVICFEYVLYYSILHKIPYNNSILSIIVSSVIECIYWLNV